MNARFKRLLSALLIGAVLFAQFSVAAYACPQAAAAAAPVQDAGQAMQAMPGCEQMDPAAGHPDPGSLNLCVEHCHFGHQAANHAEGAPVPPAALAGFISITPLLPVLVATGRAAVVARISPAASPPLSILHCCFRI